MIKRAIVILICVLAPIAAVAAASASPTAPVAPQQQTAELFTAHTVYRAPDGSRLTSVADHRPLTRERTMLPVLASTIDNSVDASGQLWLENLGGTLGTAESHGCIRLATAAITWLAARITPGVPITID